MQLALASYPEAEIKYVLKLDTNVTNKHLYCRRLLIGTT